MRDSVTRLTLKLYIGARIVSHACSLMQCYTVIRHSAQLSVLILSPTSMKSIHLSVILLARFMPITTLAKKQSRRKLQPTQTVTAVKSFHLEWIFGTGRRVPKRYSIVVVVVVISSLKIHKAFLIRSGAHRNFAFTFVLTFPTDLPSQIFKLISN